MSADLCFTTDSFFLLSSFLSSTTRGARWTELNHIWPHVSVIWKCKSKIWGTLLLINWRPKNHLFATTLTATLMTYIFGMKHDIHKQASALQTAGVSYIVSKQHELWSTNSFKLGVSFHPPSNSAFHFIARIRRRSTNRTQPNFAKRWT